MVYKVFLITFKEVVFELHIEHKTVSKVKSYWKNWFTKTLGFLYGFWVIPIACSSSDDKMFLNPTLRCARHMESHLKFPRDERGTERVSQILAEAGSSW